MKPGLQASIVWGSLPAQRHPVPAPSPTPGAPAAEHRSERRYLVNQPAELLTAGTTGPVWTAQIRDVSSRGMQLIVDEPVAAGPEVRIRWGGRDVRGTIRYNYKCDASHYRIGVELAASSDSLLVDMLGRQAEQLSEAAFLVEQQQAVLQRCLALLDLTADAMIVTSMDGTVLFWNKAAEQLYGWTRQEAMGRQAGHLFEAKTSPEIPAAVSDGELRHLRKDGSAVIVRSVSIVQTDAAGRPQALLTVTRAAGRG